MNFTTVGSCQSKKIQNIRVDFCKSYSQILDIIAGYLEEDGPHYVYTLNPEFLMRARKDKKFTDLLNSSDLSIADGIGLVFAKRYLERVESLPNDILFPVRSLLHGLGIGFSSVFGDLKLAKRLAGSDLIDRVCERAARDNLSVFFLGGWEKNLFGKRKKHHGNVAVRAAGALEEKYPGLSVIGSTSEFSYKESDDDKTVTYIQSEMVTSGTASIDIMFVAYGPKNQEEWLFRNMKHIPAKVGIGLGGSFDFVTGDLRRSPKFLQNLHLEWLFRLFVQPWRFKRILLAFPCFPFIVYIESLKSWYKSR